MSFARGESGCPDDVRPAIAWYPDGLDPALRRVVEAHAADCPECREELAFVRGEGAAPAPHAESERVYARVIERIEAYEARQRHASAPPERRAEPAGRRLARAAAAPLAAALLGALAALAASRLLAPDDAALRKARALPDVSAAAPAPAFPALDVVFRPDASAARIHAALRAIDAEIVAGPTQLGFYRLRLAPAADADAAVKALRGGGEAGVALSAQRAPARSAAR